MKLSIIIPAFNEKSTINEIIRRVKKAKLPKTIQKEIIIVDDASTDETSEIIKNLKSVRSYRQKINLGKGAAVIKGIKMSTGDILIIQDADLEYNPADFFRLVKPILDGKTKVVYGSRLKNYPLRFFGKKRTPLISHYLGNKLLTLFTNLLFLNGTSDMETGYKVFKREVVSDMVLKSKRFEFEPEITAKILKKGIKIYEVPIKVSPRGYDEGKKITWRDGFIALWTLVKYRFID